MQKLPLEVVQMAAEYVRQLILAWEHPLISTVLVRDCEGGKLGPAISDNGNTLMDVILKGLGREANELSDLATRLKTVLGVVAVGLFSLHADTIVLHSN
jgi:ribose 5-phosphate isomerase